MDVFSRFLQPTGIEPARCKPVDNTSVMLQMAAAGLGVAALPRWACEEFVRQGLLEARPLAEGYAATCMAPCAPPTGIKPVCRACSSGFAARWAT